MVEGRVEGFARVFNLDNETCLYGFWKSKSKVSDGWSSIIHMSCPSGKFCSFLIDGSFKCKPGEYEGYKCIDDRIIKDFRKNFSLEVLY